MRASANPFLTPGPSPPLIDWRDAGYPALGRRAADQKILMPKAGRKNAEDDEFQPCSRGAPRTPRFSAPLAVKFAFKKATSQCVNPVTRWRTVSWGDGADREWSFLVSGRHAAKQQPVVAIRSGAALSVPLRKIRESMREGSPALRQALWQSVQWSMMNEPGSIQYCKIRFAGLRDT